MKRLIFAALLGTAIVLPSYAANAESSKHPKSYVCHYQFDDLDNDNVVEPGEFKWKRLSLGNGAAAKHLINHPDDFTAVADTDCNAV
jgi:hypothetical protein